MDTSFREGERLRRGLPLIAAVVAAALAAAMYMGTAQNASASNWYWTPGLCKSQLQNYGVQTADGRTFNVAKAFCVGLHDHCWLSNGTRRYKVFAAVTRTPGGVVRGMLLTVQNKDTWHGTNIKILQPYMSAAEFAGRAGNLAWSVAQAENQRGCYDIHP
jgi:hypothetical protein